MKEIQLDNVGNHVREGGGEATNCGSNQLTKKFTSGDIVWVKIRDSSWWPAQVVDVKSISGSKNIKKGLEGGICVRLYGSYDYMHVDPMKYQAEFENVLKQNNWNFRDILMKALEQDLSRVKFRAKFKRKAIASEESPTSESPEVQKQKKDKIQKNKKVKSPSQKWKDEITQRTKAKKSSRLAEKEGDESSKSKRSKQQKVNTRHKADDPDSVRASLGNQSSVNRSNPRSAPDAVKKIKKANVQELSKRQVKVMQSLGLIAPCGSPFRRNFLHKIAMTKL